MEGKDDIDNDDLSKFIDDQIKKESTMNVGDFVAEELKYNDGK